MEFMTLGSFFLVSLVAILRAWLCPLNLEDGLFQAIRAHAGFFYHLITDAWYARSYIEVPRVAKPINRAGELDMIGMTDFHKEKADRVIENMRDGGADALLLFPGTDIGYYTGFSIGISERLAAALIPFHGEPVIIVNELERELRGQEPWISDVDVWLEHEDPV
ncbi:hypothetical protein AC480_06330, partial [miscellaneous Crenarchaeota group archaeon SMTZ1-55]